jgi:hypothetical protein
MTGLPVLIMILPSFKLNTKITIARCNCFLF